MTRLTLNDIKTMKNKQEKIAMLTAYDYTMASIVDEAGIDMVLVGDSLGMVMLGYENTLPVTMTEMLHHCKAVSRAVKRAMIIGDLPFLSYQASNSEAIHNAGLLLKEGGVQGVKLEGGSEYCELISKLIKAGIPVMGHLGLTPQSLHQLGGYKVQGKEVESARRLIEEALQLEAAGIFALVLESIPALLAKLITAKLSIPTIGIGAGPHCDGQVLVIQDMLGMLPHFQPKHSKKYVNLYEIITKAIQQYNTEVKAESFPGQEHSFTLPDSVLEALLTNEK
jgi:3-methyl-2-oxobutanoate hydroxymethyltransferase